MSNYPQKPSVDIARGPQGSSQRVPNAPDSVANRGIGDNPLADSGIRMVLSMSPQDGSIKPLPDNLNFEQQPNGSVRVSFPDGSVRELLPGAQGEGRMITTLADGTRIQSDLTFGEGQVSVSSISSTGEKTLLSLNENGANMQRVTADGQITNFIPDSAPELIQSFREAEAFAQAEELRQQDDFQGSEEFGDWNNYGKPADWQPEQNWQPSQFDQGFHQSATFMPPHDPYAGGIGIGARPELQEASRTDFTQDFGQWNNYGKAADWQPEQNWQPQMGFIPMHDPYAGGIGIGARPEFLEAPRTDINQDFGQWNGFIQPTQWQSNHNWQPEQSWQPPATFMPPQGNWQPEQSWSTPQYFAPQYHGEVSQINGFPPPPPTDASGFPLSPVSDYRPSVESTMNNFDYNVDVPGPDQVIEELGPTFSDDVTRSFQQLPPQN